MPVTRRRRATAPDTTITVVTIAVLVPSHIDQVASPAPIVTGPVETPASQKVTMNEAAEDGETDFEGFDNVENESEAEE